MFCRVFLNDEDRGVFPGDETEALRLARVGYQGDVRDQKALPVDASEYSVSTPEEVKPAKEAPKKTSKSSTKKSTKKDPEPAVNEPDLDLVQAPEDVPNPE